MNDQQHHTQEQDDAAFDAQFGARLKRHLHDELDPYVGSATTKLDALLAARRPSSLRIGLRWSAAAMLLLGIGVIIPVISLQLKQTKHPGVTPPTVAIRDPSRPPADAILTSWSETVDAGTVFVDPETPARMLKRVRYDKAEWKDASGKWQSAVTPADEDVILVDLQKQ
jgi:hypothetical protein